MTTTIQRKQVINRNEKVRKGGRSEKQNRTIKQHLKTELTSQGKQQPNEFEDCDENKPTEAGKANKPDGDSKKTGVFARGLRLSEGRAQQINQPDKEKKQKKVRAEEEWEKRRERLSER